MRTLLVGINAKYIHTNLAIRSLARYARERLPYRVELAEFTVNQHLEELLREIYLRKPDLLGFSCYLWNYGMVRALVPELKALLPHCFVVLGGPEVSFDSEEALAETGCDLIIAGEGEAVFCALLERLAAGESPAGIPGTVSREGKSAPPPPPAMDALPFCYEDPEQLGNRILYYEASRGCPFSCQYCLSGRGAEPSAEVAAQPHGTEVQSHGTEVQSHETEVRFHGTEVRFHGTEVRFHGTEVRFHGTEVRFRSLGRVQSDLQRFLDAKVSQVKLVDRTFNCDRRFALSIWRYLAAHDNGATNFHFELAAELLDEEQLAFLNTVRPGLFQFEIGVQSTNPATLKAVRRITVPEKLTPVVRRLQSGKNLHLHLDLIAGLPYEGYERFGASFDYVYGLAPDQLQLGFLKLLKGSGLRADREKYGLCCTGYPPYEVTRTPWLSFDELLRLHMLAEMVELYYNSGRFSQEERYLCGLFPSPFRFYEALGDYYAARGLHLAPHANVEYYGILRSFLLELGRGDPKRLCWLARYDLYAHEKARRLPDWMGEGLREQYRDAVYRWFDRPENRAEYLPEYAGLDTRQLIRAAHIEVFPFHPLTGREGRTALLFNYKRRRLDGRAETAEIRLEE